MTPNDDTVEACPRCDSSDIRQRTSWRYGAAERWHCNECGQSFTEPLRREAKQPGGNYSPEGQALLDADPDDLLPDGGTRAGSSSSGPTDTRITDLTAFQRDILYVIGGFEAGLYAEYTADNYDRPHGLAIAAVLAERYDTEICHGRLYPNLTTLADIGLIETGALDDRMNGHTLTGDARELLRGDVQWKRDCVDGSGGSDR